jgi:hypothetical protein
VLLRALVETPELRLRMLAGEDALDRHVGGVFTTDLLDPRRYLSGAEIVLTGLMWHRTVADSEVFVSALAAAGVAALAAGDAALGSVPPDLVEACRHHRLPLLEVPVDVSFGAITEQVVRARLQAGPDSAAVRRRLLAGARTGAVPPAGQETAGALGSLFTAAQAEYGMAGWVLSPAGRLVAGVSPAPSAACRFELVAGWLSSPVLPVTVTTGGAHFSLFGVAGQPAQRRARWFVCLAGDHTAWDDELRAVAAELSGLVAGYRSRQEKSRRAARGPADAMLQQVLRWRPGTAECEEQEIVAAMSRSGLPAPDGLAVVAVALPGAAPLPGAVPPGPPEPEQVAQVLLEDMLPGAVVGRCGGGAVAFAPAGAQVFGQIRDAVGRLARVPRLDLSVGVSLVAAARRQQERGHVAGADEAGTGWTAAEVSRAVAEARRAGRIAALLGPGARMIEGSRLGSYELLLALVPEEAGLAYRTKLLAPLLAYDRDHGTELVRTLEVFLACSGSWTKAARAMFVHVNSLRYRIRRIEDLTGRDLHSLADQAALLLALRLAGSAKDQPVDPGGSGAGPTGLSAG